MMIVDKQHLFQSHSKCPGGLFFFFMSLLEAVYFPLLGKKEKNIDSPISVFRFGIIKLITVILFDIG